MFLNRDQNMYLCGSLCCQGSSRITALLAAGGHTHTHTAHGYQHHHLPSPSLSSSPPSHFLLPASYFRYQSCIDSSLQAMSACLCGPCQPMAVQVSAGQLVCVLHTYYLQLCLSSARLVTVLVEVKDPMSKYTLSTCYDCTLVR